jgi:hypothetical protein
MLENTPTSEVSERDFDSDIARVVIGIRIDFIFCHHCDRINAM